MNKLVKIGILAAALVLVDLILPEPFMWVWGLIILIVLVRLTRHDGKPKRDHLVLGFIIAILVLVSWYITANYVSYNTPNAVTLAAYLQILYVVLDVGFVMLGFMIVLSYRYLR